MTNVRTASCVRPMPRRNVPVRAPRKEGCVVNPNCNFGRFPVGELAQRAAMQGLDPTAARKFAAKRMKRRGRDSFQMGELFGWESEPPSLQELQAIGGVLGVSEPKPKSGKAKRYAPDALIAAWKGSIFDAVNNQACVKEYECSYAPLLSITEHRLQVEGVLKKQRGALPTCTVECETFCSNGSDCMYGEDDQPARVHGPCFARFFSSLASMDSTVRAHTAQFTTRAHTP